MGTLSMATYNLLFVLAIVLPVSRALNTFEISFFLISLGLIFAACISMYNVVVPLLLQLREDKIDKAIKRIDLALAHISPSTRTDDFTTLSTCTTSSSHSN